MKPRPNAPARQATGAAAHSAAEPSPVNWELLGLAARLLVGGVLIFSGLHKAAAPAEEFSVVLEAYAILPETHVLLMSRLIPWAELLSGAFLLFGLMTRAAAAASATLLGTFIFAILSTKARGIILENCGCFGQGVHLSPGQAVALDLFLFASAVFAWKHGRKRMSLDNWVEEGI